MVRTFDNEQLFRNLLEVCRHRRETYMGIHTYYIALTAQSLLALILHVHFSLSLEYGSPSCIIYYRQNHNAYSCIMNIHTYKRRHD